MSYPMQEYISTLPEDLIDVTVDFETFYDSECSLSKLTVASYLFHKEFEIIGVGMKIANRETRWYSFETKEEYAELFSKIPWHKVRLIGHNLLFDAAILAWHFGIFPAMYFCTMQGARKDIVAYSHSMSLAKISTHLGIGTKGHEVVQAKGKHLCDFTPDQLAAYGRYCVTDVDLCYAIYHECLKDFDPDEQTMLHLTIRKGVAPQALWDKQVLEDALLAEQVRKQTLLKSCGVEKEDLMSNAKFAQLLRNFGVEPPMKISPTTNKQTYAFAKTDLGFRELQEHPNPKVRTLVEARLGNKSTLMETRLQRLIKIADDLGGACYFPLLYYGAHTGRLSGLDNINMQNPPQGSAIRQALRAPDGYSIVAGDLSQIEARITAWLAGQHDLVQQFRDKEDVYSRFAETLYDMPYGSITKDTEPDKRFMGKTCILGLGFQLGGTGFSIQISGKGIPVSIEEGEEIVSTYRQTFPQIKRLWYKMGDLLKIGARGGSAKYKCIRIDGEVVTLPGGRTIHYPELYEDASGEFFYKNNKGKWTKIYGGKLTENVVQALAQMLVRNIELELAKLKIYALGQVHDELIFAIPTEKAKRFGEIVAKLMRIPPTWAMDLPVDCEVLFGPNYLACK